MKKRVLFVYLSVIVVFLIQLIGCASVPEPIPVPSFEPKIEEPEENPEIHFDIDNTTAILEESLKEHRYFRRQITIDDVINALIKSEIRGVIRINILSGGGNKGTAKFVFESEDNKIYEIFLVTGYSGGLVCYIVDKKTDEMLYYVHNPGGHVGPQG